MYISFIIASKEPLKLAKFYQAAMSYQIISRNLDKHCLLRNPEGSFLDIYRPSKKSILISKGNSSSICFRTKPSTNPITTIYKWNEKLISFGSISLEDPRLEVFGAECWMADPEGNNFLLLVPITENIS